MDKKYEEIMEEVLDEIESALKDPKGITSHQRRLSFSLSLGIVTTRIDLFSTSAYTLWENTGSRNKKRLISVKYFTILIVSLLRKGNIVYI